mgnify:CR=1 FL=1
MGLNVLFEGSNFERLLGGLWVTAKIAFVSVFSPAFSVFFSAC